MKRWMKWFIGAVSVIVIVVVHLFVLDKKTEEAIIPEFKFHALVLENNETYLLIEPIEGSAESASASKITVPIKNMDPTIEPKVGDIIEITYNGMIAESFPAQITTVYGITMIQEAIEDAFEDNTEPITVYPLPVTIDLNNVKDCTLAVSIENGDITKADTGKAAMKVKVYYYELFDLVDISLLEAGSAKEIVLDKKVVKITSIERNELGEVIINGGLDVGGYELVTNENGVFYSIGYSDIKTFHEVGEIELEIAPNFVYIDASDLDAGEKQYTLDDVITSLEYRGTPRNTSIVVEDGIVTSMKKIYVP